MSRPRLEAHQKKMSFSLAFSPNLIAALDKVRGAKSQSVFVEEWLRQNPQIMAELALMNDPGFKPPSLIYEQLMERLLKFYSPRKKRPSLASTLFIAQKVIIREDTTQPESIQEQIVAALAEFWLGERRKHRATDCAALGENLEAALPFIKDYARFFYEVIFMENANGERKLLQQHFRSLVRGCEAIYQKRAEQAADAQFV